LGISPKPARTKITQVSRRVAIVIPEMGFEDDPNKPTIRDETVTKKKPNKTISKPANKDNPIAPLNTDEYK
jgi:hypothetical protein